LPILDGRFAVQLLQASRSGNLQVLKCILDGFGLTPAEGQQILSDFAKRRTPQDV